MQFRNDGKGEVNILQNTFTKYLVTAIQRRKTAILRKQETYMKFEFPMDMTGDTLWLADDRRESDSDELIELQIELDSLTHALEQLSERERQILVARLNGCGYSELAKRFCLSYKGVAAIYYRTLLKVQRELRGDEQ